MPREFIGNELYNVPLLHPNHEMDARPARRVTIPRVCWSGGGACIVETEHIAPNWADIGNLSFEMAGCGAD